MKYRSPWTVIVIGFFTLVLAATNILTINIDLTTCPECEEIGQRECYHHHNVWSRRDCLSVFSLIVIVVTPVLLLIFILILIFVWRMDDKDSSYRWCSRILPCCLISEDDIEDQLEFHRRCSYGENGDNRYVYLSSP